MILLIISDNYPSLYNPTSGIFLYNAVQVYKKNNINVLVLSPLNIKYIFNRKINYGEELAIVYRPLYFSLSNFNFFSLNTYHIGHLFFKISIDLILKFNNLKYDYIYCHFIWSYLFCYNTIIKQNKKIFVGIGENKRFDEVKSLYSKKYFHNAISNVTGFITVSNQLKNKLIEDLNILPSKILVAPNATDQDIFKPLNKFECRSKLNFSSKEFIIIFVGRFVVDKGPNRILEAIKDTPIKIILIGDGPLLLNNYDNILFKGKITTNKIVDYYCASDLFILPTLHEGSSNAIMEAMSCGLPIISSNIPEIREQCTSDCSILVDPFNIEEIKKTILSLKNDTIKLNKMSNASLENSRKFNLKNRVLNITNFIKSFI